MAVYERIYRPWKGSPTPAWTRFLIIPKYAFKEVFSKKSFMQFYITFCLLWPILCLVFIYLRYNFRVALEVGLPMDKLPQVDAMFFYVFLSVQSFIGFFVAFIAGPSLISIDMIQNGLPLYFSRPMNRFDYVLGKFSVMGILLSLATWIPGIILFFFQVSLAGLGFFRDNARILLALFIGSWAWITVLTLLVLAISAYVKKKQTARGIIIMVFVIFSSFGEIASEVLSWRGARYLKIGDDIRAVWAGLLSLDTDLDPVMAGIVLICFAGLSLFLLERKIRPIDIVK